MTGSPTRRRSAGTSCRSRRRRARPSVVTVSDSSARPTSRPTTTTVSGGRCSSSSFWAVDHLVGPRARRRVVDRQHQVGLGDRAQPPLDHRPRLEPVGEADHREVAADRRTRPRGDGLDGADTRAARGSTRRRTPGPRPPRRPPPPSRRPRRRRRTPRRPARRRGARSSASRARSTSTVLPDACRVRPGALRHPVDVRRVADDVVDLGQRRG